MKLRIITLLLALWCLSPSYGIAASASIKGSYSGNINYESGTPIGSGTCYTREAYPYISFTLTGVKLKGEDVTGRYWNGASYVRASGKKTKSGFNVSFNYTLGGYTYRYTIKASSISSSSAKIKLTGTTNWSASYGCKYVFAGPVLHSK